MYRIIVIGAGQLGSRHLQALCASESVFKITVIDPSLDSLNIAKSRAEQIGCTHSQTTVEYLQDIPERSFDVCIIATSANVRLRVMEAFYARAKTRYMILEKVLFQSLADYQTAKQLLKANHTIAWVNCPRRMNPFYRDIRDRLIANKKEIKHMRVSGQNWGMACNSIHFVDLFAYLTGNSAINIKRSLLEPRLVESKRAGFVECYGELQLENGFGGLLEVACTESDEPLKIVVELYGEGFHCTVDEIGRECKKYAGLGADVSKFEQPPQSQLSGINVNQILQGGECWLTPYDESVSIHLPIIQVFLEHINTLRGEDSELCPIT